jgi:hypothetical protein
MNVFVLLMQLVCLVLGPIVIVDFFRSKREAQEATQRRAVSATATAPVPGVEYDRTFQDSNWNGVYQVSRTLRLDPRQSDRGVISVAYRNERGVVWSGSWHVRVKINEAYGFADCWLEREPTLRATGVAPAGTPQPRLWDQKGDRITLRK